MVDVVVVSQLLRHERSRKRKKIAMTSLIFRQNNLETKNLPFVLRPHGSFCGVMTMAAVASTMPERRGRHSSKNSQTCTLKNMLALKMSVIMEDCRVTWIAEVESELEPCFAAALARQQPVSHYASL